MFRNWFNLVLYVYGRFWELWILQTFWRSMWVRILCIATWELLDLSPSSIPNNFKTWPLHHMGDFKAHFCTYLCSVCTYTLYYWEFAWSIWPFELCDFQGVVLCDAAAAFCFNFGMSLSLWTFHSWTLRFSAWTLLETTNRNHFNVKCGELFQRGTLNTFFTG